MKKISMLIFVLLSFLNSMSQNNFYSLPLISSTGAAVDLSVYRGKKVIIVTANEDSLLLNASNYLGAVQAKYPNVPVLVLPINFGTDTTSAINSNVYPAVSNIIYGTVANSQPADYSQYPLLQWLLTDRDGQHFQPGPLTDGQFFIVSESGVLYATMKNPVPDGFFSAVLTAPDVTQ